MIYGGLLKRFRKTKDRSALGKMTVSAFGGFSLHVICKNQDLVVQTEPFSQDLTNTIGVTFKSNENR